MFNSRSLFTIIVVIGAVLMGGSAQIFAISLEGILSEDFQGARDISAMFDSKGKVANLYAKSLKLVQDTEMNTSYESIEYLMKINPDFPKCNVSKTDVLNVLYDGNDAFRAMLEQTVLKKSKKKVSVPTHDQMVRSEEKIIHCWNPEVNNFVPDQYASIRNTLNGQYQRVLDNVYNINTIQKATFGEDLFANGKLDDSDYDLVADIDQIRKRLFDGFTPTPSLSFYQFDSQGGAGGQNLGGGAVGAGFTPGGEFVTLGSTPVTATNSQRLTAGGGASPSITTNQTVNSILTGTTINGIDEFIQKTDAPGFAPNQSSPAAGNQCVAGVAGGEVAAALVIGPNDCIQRSGGVLKNGQSVTGFSALTQIAPKTCLGVAARLTCSNGAISGAYQVYQYASCTDVVPVTNTTLITSLLGGPTDPAFIPSVSGIGTSSSAQIANAIQALGSDANVQKCTDACDGLPLGDAISCRAQCLCFKVSGPTDAQLGLATGELKKMDMEEIYKMTFCKVPVEDVRLNNKKKVSSIDEIFTVYRNILSSLVNGGEILKRVPTKEFFDTSFAGIKFNDIISFQIVFQKKPLFANKPPSSIKAQQKAQNSVNQNALLNISPVDGNDDKNKYVIIADVAQNKAEKEYIPTLDEFNKKVDTIKAIDDSSRPILPNALKIGQDEKVAKMNENVGNFIINNIKFWDSTLLNFMEMSNLADILNNMIQSKG